MNEEDLPEDLASPERKDGLAHDPMFWVATVFLLVAVGMVLVGIANGAMR